jgi:hypothetical protein
MYSPQYAEHVNIFCVRVWYMFQEEARARAEAQAKAREDQKRKQEEARAAAAEAARRKQVCTGSTQLAMGEQACA